MSQHGVWKTLAWGMLAGLVLVACKADESEPWPPPWWDATPSTIEDTAPQPFDIIQPPPPPSRRDTSGGSDDSSDELPDGVLADGEACSSASECAGGTCLPSSAWPDGYCTFRGCMEASDCSGGDSSCQVLNGTRLCLAKCAEDDDCREGYWCDAHLDGGHCIAGSRPEPLLADGEACAVGTECAGGTCLVGEDWPGGYCTRVACFNASNCNPPEGGSSVCVSRLPHSICMRGCEGAADCRADSDYICATSRGETDVCQGRDTVAPQPRFDVDDYPYLNGFRCQADPGSTPVITFNVAADTTSFAIVPIARDGGSLTPVSMTLPGGDVVEFSGEVGFQVLSAELLEFAAPIVVPAIRSQEEWLKPGQYKLHLESTSSDLCWLLLEQADAPPSLNINIYFVGLDDLSAATAAEDPRVEALLAAVRTVFGGAGIQVPEPLLIDMHATHASRYRVIRSMGAFGNLVALSEVPGSSLGDALSLNIFLVEGFVIPGVPGLVGLAAGIPGVPGVHSTPGSGVALSVEFLGDEEGNQMTALILAHEVGHFLGLFHTSEMNLRAWDPLDDTPRCTAGFPNSCPDLQNLMFPVVAPDHTELSDQQIEQLLANPLTHAPARE